MKTLSIILTLSAALSFSIGRMAGDYSSEKVEESLSEIFSSLSLIQEVESINANKKIVRDKNLSNIDPNL